MRLTRFLQWLCILPATAGGWTSCGAEVKSTRIGRLGSGVLIIEIDAWRRDHLSLYGYEKPTTPFLQEWAQDCLVFEDAWSTGSHLLPATASLLSGSDPLLCKHPGFPLENGKVVSAAFPWMVPKAMPMLAFQFLAAGWRTGLFDSTGEVNAYRGVHVGFETMSQRKMPASDLAEFRSLPELTGQWLDWLQELETGEDWFAYFHVADLERFSLDPKVDEDLRGPKSLEYIPPIGADEPTFHVLPPSRLSPNLQTMADYMGAYDSAVRRLDQDLRELVATLEEKRLLGRTTVIVVGAYGISFGESGLLAASGTLSEVDLAVPLVIRPAVDLGVQGGARIPGLISLTDVAPTALDLAQIPIPEGWNGASVRPLWESGTPVREYAYAVPSIHDGFAVIDSKGMFIRLWPQKLGRPGLAQSWFGHGDVGATPVDVLLARREGLRPFAYRQGVPDPVWADELRAKGLAWKQLGDQLSQSLLGEAWGGGIPSTGSDEALEEILPPWAK